VRRARPLLALTLAALATLPALDAGGADVPRCFGAASRDPEQPCRNPALRTMVRPSPRAALDAPNAPCEPVPGAQLQRCTFGSPPEDATATVALIGDSHATHWRAAMLKVVARRRWQGISITRSGCPFTRARPDLPDSRECVNWNAQVLRFLESRPDITKVFVAQHRGRVIAPPGRRPREVQIEGYVDAWAALPPSVQDVVVIRATPYTRTYTGRCIAQAVRRGQEPGQVCAIPRRIALKTDPAALASRRSEDPRVVLADLSEFFCGPRLCYPVIGGALVHKDQTHISLTFGLTLGPYLLREVDRLLGR